MANGVHGVGSTTNGMAIGGANVGLHGTVNKGGGTRATVPHDARDGSVLRWHAGMHGTRTQTNFARSAAKTRDGTSQDKVKEKAPMAGEHQPRLRGSGQLNKK